MPNQSRDSQRLLCLIAAVALPACFSEADINTTSGAEASDTGEVDTETEADGSDGETSTEGETSTDDGETSTDDGESDESSSTEGEPVECDEGYTCAPSVPDGWSGPVVLYSGDDAPPECPDGFTFADDAFADLEAEAASCACGCGDVEGVDCGQPSLYSSASNSCGGLQFYEATLDEDTCSGIGSLSTYIFIRYDDADFDSAACPATLDVDVPDASWSTFARTCAPTGVQACDGGSVCVEDLAGEFDSGACVWREGDFACPTDYPQAHVFHGDYDDQRGCAEDCDCIDPDPTCAGSVGMYEGGACHPNFLEATLEVDDCLPRAQYGIESNVHARQDSAGVEGGCTPTGGTPSGMATPTQPVTVCCAP